MAIHGVVVSFSTVNQFLRLGIHACASKQDA